ncbi:hypothetical protein J0664_05815 [Rhizobium leguminosarum]|uniref:hypothetical protein n=1 Tax=Rhizobium leguminosarum TaxID=384 RepID=UPI001A9379C3|nr:hypothetical protein [Rhizobium leguminosarum]MBY5553774.1 hypothetical protein [Rhizobium leguminosarum]QSW24816.1 hypothetical protein J0664_05815 [Rhizobium leguminosarum]
MSAVWTPPLPYELVEATEHHGPYICTSYGTTVCDFYFMTDPAAFSVRNGGTSRPISFTDAAEHAAFMVKAANVHDDLLDALRDIVGDAEFGCHRPAYLKARAAIAKAEGRS